MSVGTKQTNRVAATWINRLHGSTINGMSFTETTEALAGLGPVAVPTLIEAWAEDDHSVRMGVHTALGHIAGPAFQSILRALEHEQPRVRLEAALFLQQVADRPDVPVVETVSVLIAALRDDESSVRLRAIQAIMMLRERAIDAMPALIEMLDDPESYVREWAADALGSIGPTATAAVPALTDALLDDEDADVRQAAMEALHIIGNV